MSDLKFCVHCVHAEPTENAYYCGKTKVVVGVDLVFGFPRVKWDLCKEVRDDEAKCGITGKWFELSNKTL